MLFCCSYRIIDFTVQQTIDDFLVLDEGTFYTEHTVGTQGTNPAVLINSLHDLNHDLVIHIFQNCHVEIVVLLKHCINICAQCSLAPLGQIDQNIFRNTAARKLDNAWLYQIAHIVDFDTRERVEILPDDRPPTKRQTQLIEKLTKDFPDIPM